MLVCLRLEAVFAVGDGAPIQDVAPPAVHPGQIRVAVLQRVPKALRGTFAQGKGISVAVHRSGCGVASPSYSLASARMSPSSKAILASAGTPSSSAHGAPISNWPSFTSENALSYHPRTGPQLQALTVAPAVPAEDSTRWQENLRRGAAGAFSYPVACPRVDIPGVMLVGPRLLRQATHQILRHPRLAPSSTAIICRRVDANVPGCV